MRLRTRPRPAEARGAFSHMWTPRHGAPVTAPGKVSFRARAKPTVGKSAAADMAPPPTRQPRLARGTSPSGRSRLGLIVTGSLVTGLVLALLLVLVVFAGAREHVITGAAHARVRVRLGDARGPVDAANRPAATVGLRPRPPAWRSSVRLCCSSHRETARLPRPAGCGHPSYLRSPPGWASSCAALSLGASAGCSTRSWRSSLSAPSAGCTKALRWRVTSTPTPCPARPTMSAATGCT